MPSRNAVRHNNVASVALQVYGGNGMYGPPYTPGAVNFKYMNSELVDQTETWPITPKGPLSIYAAVGVQPRASDQPTLLYYRPRIGDYTFQLQLGWAQPRLDMQFVTTLGLLCSWSRALCAPPDVDWSQPVGATRIVALSLPDPGTAGTAKWYFGNNRWGRVNEPADDFTTLFQPLSVANVFMGGAGYNGFSVHELRLIPTYHRDDTVVATFNALAARWGATV